VPKPIQKPSYSLNNSSLFFGLSEVDFIFLGLLFLSGLLVFKQFESLRFLPLLHLLICSLSLVFLRLNFRRHTVRDFLSRAFNRRVQVIYPKLTHHFDLRGHRFWVFENLSLLTAFEVDGIDPERDDLEDVSRHLTQFALSLDPKITLKINLSSQWAFSSSSTALSSRKEELSEIGFSRDKITISLETQIGGFSQLIKTLLRKKSSSVEESYALSLLDGFNLKHLEEIGLKFRALKKPPVLSTQGEFIRILKAGIEISPEIFGIVKFQGPTPTALNLNSLHSLRQQIPEPYQISLKVRKMPSSLSELLLRRKSSQGLSGGDKISAQKYYDSEDLLEKVALERESLFNYELYVILPRVSEELIREDSKIVIHALKPMGAFALETFGSFNCFKSLLPGSSHHLSFKERGDILSLYFPLLGARKKRVEQKSQNIRHEDRNLRDCHSLYLHRRDHSLDSIDLFDKRYDAFSTIICGKTGSGKSVLTNLLTRALLHDTRIHIIKVDVGGSHSKETENLGGREYRLSLDKPSGMNPFLCLKEGVHESSISVLSNFLNVLMTEEGELTLSKELRAQVERALFLYAEGIKRKDNETLSIDGFLKESKDLPRKSLLYRWAKGGIYQNALISGQEQNPSQDDCRLRYYNFSDIHQASDADFGQGGFSLVMAQFNLEMIRSKDKKLVFIADETPFFIKRCFPFFKFSTANVRKFGGSFISISQKSTDLIVQNDQGIIENSPNRLLFSVDGERKEFQERFQLSRDKMQSLENLTREQKRFSEVLYQDKFGSRIFRIILSPEEYWRFSSTREDNQKIESLMKTVPRLTRLEAIRVLSLDRKAQD
jgi:energy-coupling factor transporter ATP-binding protein EcfA2